MAIKRLLLLLYRIFPPSVFCGW